MCDHVGPCVTVKHARPCLTLPFIACDFLQCAMHVLLCAASLKTKHSMSGKHKGGLGDGRNKGGEASRTGNSGNEVSDSGASALLNFKRKGGSSLS
jgi:hypothetical protein